MPLPTLASFEEEAAKVKHMSEENETLKARLAALGGLDPETRTATVPETVATDLMDDFYIIAQ
jgi:hypothetical protein